MKQNRSSVILIIVFLVLILLPFPLWGLSGGRFDMPLNENRMPAEKPVLKETGIDAFPQAYEAYLDDHLPFRNAMLRSYSAIEYGLLKSSLSYMVIFGKDGWLYHRDRYDGDPVSLYKGLRLPDEKALAQIRESMLKTRDNLEKEGIEFVLFFAPLKSRVYPEYMPDVFGEPASPYSMQVVIEDLQKNTDLRIVYAYEDLLTAKEVLGEKGLLYYKADSHWNELGAYAGTLPLLKELGITMPSYDSDDITITNYPADKEDMIILSNTQGLIDPGETYSVTGYDKNGLVCKGGVFEEELFFEAPEAPDHRKVFMKHDSYAEAMEGMFCSRFRETVLVHNLAYESSQVDKYKPDVFVYEIAERNGYAALVEVLYE